MVIGMYYNLSFESWKYHVTLFIIKTHILYDVNILYFKLNASSTLSPRRSEAARARECSRFTRLVSSRLASPRARSTPSRYFGRESKDHETRDEAYLLHSRLSSRVLS